MKTLIALVSLSSSLAFADIKRHGNYIDVSCFAVSMSQGFARKAAIEDCKKSVAGVLDPTIKVNSKLWTTQTNVYMHEETDSLTTYEGLVCQPSNEQVEDLGKQVKVYLDCRFDISKIKALKDQNMETGKTLNITNAVKSKIETDNQAITIASFPRCDKISIVGGDEVVCNSKSMILDIKQDVRELIVEKAGYLPYRVELNGSPQSLMIILSPL